MAEHVRDYRPATPKERVSAEPGYFYVGEACRILGLSDLDYRQSRALFRFVREQSGRAAEPGRWSRYTLTDLAMLDRSVELCGGQESLRARSRLQFRPLQRACASLRALGFANPILDVPLIRSGAGIFVVARGVLFDPVTGQVALESVHQAVQSSIGGQRAMEPALRMAITEELQRHRHLAQPALVDGLFRIA